jgi:hypothetical protein
MSFFHSHKSLKETPNIELFEKLACDERLMRCLAAKFVGVTNVAKLLPYLLEDDRIGCEFNEVDKSTGKIIGYKPLVGGYFRFYNPGNNTIYLSPFERSAQLELGKYIKHKLMYHMWELPSIRRLYITPMTEERIRKQMEAEKRRPPPSTPQPQRRKAVDDSQQEAAAMHKSLSESRMRRLSAPPMNTIFLNGRPTT